MKALFFATALIAANAYAADILLDASTSYDRYEFDTKATLKLRSLSGPLRISNLIINAGACQALEPKDSWIIGASWVQIATTCKQIGSANFDAPGGNYGWQNPNNQR